MAAATTTQRAPAQQTTLAGLGRALVQHQIIRLDQATAIQRKADESSTAFIDELIASGTLNAGQLARFIANDREALVSYSDEQTLRDAGQGGFEIRTFVAVAGATEGATGELLFYAPIPIFAVGCTVATMNVQPRGP